MVLFQSARRDQSTNDVLDWLFMLGTEVDFHRLNDDSQISKLTCIIGKQASLEFETDKGKVEVHGIEGFWYRRGRLAFRRFAADATAAGLLPLIKEFNRNVTHDNHVVTEFVDHVLAGSKNATGRFSDNHTNKILNLSVARDCLLAVPETIVTNSIEALCAFSAKHQKIITKSLDYTQIIAEMNGCTVLLSLATAMCTPAQVTAINRDFPGIVCAPALFQQYIEKRYELRIFYLKGKFYTMAIFSQSNPKTMVDFRSYDTVRPNRCVPYQLPAQVEEKLENFMQATGLNCGSIDMINTPDGEYVFLEVNPVGQFQWLSKNCNYDIERQIASHLLEGTWYQTG